MTQSEMDRQLLDPLMFEDFFNASSSGSEAEGFPTHEEIEAFTDDLRFEFAPQGGGDVRAFEPELLTDDAVANCSAVYIEPAADARRKSKKRRKPAGRREPKQECNKRSKVAQRRARAKGQFIQSKWVFIPFADL